MLDAPSGCERSIVVGPESTCMTRSASGALLPGFVVPNAQMMLSGARLLLSFCVRRPWSASLPER